MKLQEAVAKVHAALDGADLGLAIGQIQTRTKLSNKTVKAALAELDVEFDGVGYRLRYEPPQDEPSQAKKPRNKPFTPNPIMGYQVDKGKVKIFLDRRATSKTLTLTAEHLSELVNAVSKL